MVNIEADATANYRGINQAWTDELIQLVIDEWNGGQSGQQIADLIGRTRNAVIGKLARLREAGVQLAQHSNNPLTRDARRERRAKNEKRRRERLQRKAASSFTVAAPPELLARAEALVDEAIFALPKGKQVGVRPEDLENHHCRWPLGDPQSKEFRHCGEQKAPGLSYCPSCARRAFPQLTPLALTTMTLMCREMEEARRQGRPSPYAVAGSVFLESSSSQTPATR